MTVLEHEGFALSLQTLPAELRDRRIEKYVGEMPRRRDASDFLRRYGQLHAKFSHHAQLGDFHRDRREWLAGYSEYVRALDYLPLYAGYFIQAGHCLKEAGLYGAAEAHYRTALILGEAESDVVPHLLHCCYRSRFHETADRLIAIQEQAMQGSGEREEIATVYDVWRVVKALGVESVVPLGLAIDFMRRSLSVKAVAKELVEQHLSTLVERPTGPMAFPNLPPPAGAIRSRGTKTVKRADIPGSGFLRRGLDCFTDFIHWHWPPGILTRKQQRGGPIVLRLTYGATTGAPTEGPVAVSSVVDIAKITLLTRNERLVLDMSSPDILRSCVAYGGVPHAGRLRSQGNETILLVWVSDSDEVIDLRIEAALQKGLRSLDCTVTTSSGLTGNMRWQGKGGGYATASLRKGPRTIPGAEAFDTVSCMPGTTNVSDRGAPSPVVSVIIVNKNRPCLSLLAMLSSNVISIPYEIILVENGSAPDLRVKTSNAPPHRRLVSDVNLKFGGANNLAAADAKGEFLLFLNNDAVLTSGGVESLLIPFHAERDCGISGPVFRYPDGLLQEAGAFVEASGMTWQRGKFDKDFSVASLERHGSVDYVSGACLAIRNKTFHELGGFRQEFDLFGYYDDVDLCMRAKQAGLRTVLVRDAVCFHVEGATGMSGADLADGGRALFEALWREELNSRVRPDGAGMDS